MKKILLSLACFFACIFSVQAQTLYGLTSNGGNDGGGGTLIKFMPAANNLTVAKSFEVYAANPDGTNFIRASDGKLYGMTNRGGNGSRFAGPGFGNDTYGVIFSFDPSTSTYKMLKAFDYTNGARPSGSLVQASDGRLYGMTWDGGSSGYGVVFSFDPSTSIYTKLKDFDGTNGRNPYGSLIQAGDGKLYGMTHDGGSSGYGVIFSFDPSTSIYTKLVDFDFTNGRNPYGSLVQASNGKLYGMTVYGGSSDCGVIFYFDPFSSTCSKLKDFVGTNDGAFPYGSLLQASNGKLYGMTTQGGSSGYNSVIFSFDPSTSTYTKVKDYDVINGTLYGSLMQASDSKLYGITQEGGSNNGGVIFSFDPSGSTFTKLKDFDSSTWNPLTPHGDCSLMQADNGILYGMTGFGGSSNYSNLAIGTNPGNGVIFSFDPSSSVYTKLMNLDSNSSGTWPSGTVMQASNGKLYGTATRGGSKGWGVIFSFDPCNSTYTKLMDFDSTNGGEPFGSLIQAKDGKLYGTTNSGNYIGGVIFSFDPSTSAYTILTREIGTSISLMQASDGKLYGMGFAGRVLFSFDPTTSTLTIIPFSGNFAGSLIQASDGKLYGTAIQDVKYEGVIFSFDPSTSTYTNLYDFHDINGSYPFGSLMQASDGKLYGTTNQGGSNGVGVIFSFDPSTSTYTKLKDFDNTNGASPYGSLMQASDGKLYGMTNRGGSNGVGVIFSFDPSTSTYTKLQDFNGINGAKPDLGSAFIVVANSGGNCTTPVTLLSFTGKNNGNYNQLNWKVEDELNLNYYELQRGIDGQHFTSIAQIKAAGNNSYSYNDPIATTVSFTYYYRLKSVDIDGKFTYSKICIVNFTAPHNIISVSPNPVKNILQLTNPSGETFTGRSASATINIYSSAMQLVKTIKVTQADRNTITIPVDRLAAGIYFLQLVNANGIRVVKFVKE